MQDKYKLIRNLRNKSQVLYPAVHPTSESLAYPARNHDIIFNQGVLTPDITFTRASAAFAHTYGNLSLFSTNAARFGGLQNESYTGLLMESAATNLLLQSSALNTTWTPILSTVTANTTVAPDGTTSADTLARTTIAANFLTQTISKAASAIQYTLSWHVHRTAGTADYVAFRAQGAFPARIDVCYRKSTNTIVSSSATTFTGLTSGIKTIDANYVRVWMTFTTDTAVVLESLVSPRTSDGEIDSADASSTATCILWQPDLVTGAFAGSPIPTTTAAVTRAADVSGVSNINTKPWFNATEGTLFVDFQRGAEVNINTCALSVDNGSVTSNGILIQQADTAFNLEFNIQAFVAGVLVLSQSISSGTANIRAKIAVAYKDGDWAICLNGGTVYTSAVAVPAGLTTMRIGKHTAVADTLNGVIKNVAFYGARLPNSTLQTITA